MPFQEVGQAKKKATYVAEQIIDAIKQGACQIEDKLPSERDIAKQMKVSRNSVREALSALQILGVIESRAGAGTYIRSSVKNNANIDQVVSFVKKSEDLFEVWEARKEIEDSLVKFAINRASKEDIDKIAGALAAMRKATLAEDYDGFLGANTDFHLSVGKAADNLPLMNALRSLLEITTQELLEELKLGYVWQEVEECFAGHEAIVEAIRKHDEKAGAKAVRNHFRDLGKYTRGRYPQEENQE
ncbi:FadR family transcriptional regulator [Candidatus Bipolaricaulota bacterium]|nr:FadR family transcriptional regulator [Candidatus Bipolaricaulota bacterium]